MNIFADTLTVNSVKNCSRGLKSVFNSFLCLDSGYSDAIAETSSYSSSYVSSTTPKSVYSTCSCGSQQTSASSSSDFCSRPDDLSQMSGPLTEESILKVLHQRWKFGECQVQYSGLCSKPQIKRNLFEVGNDTACHLWDVTNEFTSLMTNLSPHNYFRSHYSDWINGRCEQSL